MSRLFALVVALMLVGCETPAGLSYYGEDAGWLVVGIGSEAVGEYPAGSSQGHELLFRGKNKSDRGFVQYVQNNPLHLQESAKDFDDENGAGIVAVLPVRPGDYEFYNFRVSWATNNREWGSAKDFSIPFTIKPGHATYVGDFKAVAMSGQSRIGLTVPSGAYLLFSDRRTRDVPVAKRKVPTIGDVDFFIPDIERIGNPLLRRAPTGMGKQP